MKTIELSSDRNAGNMHSFVTVGLLVARSRLALKRFWCFGQIAFTCCCLPSFPDGLEYTDLEPVGVGCRRLSGSIGHAAGGRCIGLFLSVAAFLYFWLSIYAIFTTVVCAAPIGPDTGQFMLADLSTALLKNGLLTCLSGRSNHSISTTITAKPSIAA